MFKFSSPYLSPLEENENEGPSSKGTSIGYPKGKYPALFTRISWPSGGRVLDYGAGRPNTAEALEGFFQSQGLEYFPYDKHWGKPGHESKWGDGYNAYTVSELSKKPATLATCSNVLNVLKSENDQLAALRNIKRLIVPGSKVYITTWEGDKNKGQPERATGKDSYQLYKPTADYIEVVEEVFSSIELSTISGINIIIAQ